MGARGSKIDAVCDSGHDKRRQNKKKCHAVCVSLCTCLDTLCVYTFACVYIYL
eukprot:NODE_9079_length_332_cov_62.901060_g7317_i0.p2 GENE.NODE_9079_length_332_cov_62.901060_g7317_i0~~NODE_9079_length_332_cov_62.901060_g7317_i0.p2  ORF type:complete len:53 (-),score=9.45 NODE_9079_length_332_cov_62.901060_g7317_i0:69-227(-)